MAKKTIMESTTMLATIRDWANGKFLTSGDIATAYKAGGNKQASDLVSALLIASNEGKVYNLSTVLTITSDNVSLFKDGVIGNSYPIGTNVVVIQDGVDGSDNPVYKFDILAGFIDTSAFLTANDVVDGGNTASWGNPVTVGTIGGVDVKFTMPANPNTHYTAVPIVGGVNDTTNVQTDTSNPYVNIVENSAKSGGIQIAGGDNVSVKGNGGVVTIEENFSWMTQQEALAILTASA